MTNMNTIFYNPLGHEIGRVNHEFGEAVPIPEGASDFRQWLTTRPIMPPRMNADVPPNVDETSEEWRFMQRKLQDESDGM
jgi:hypothetical protein